MGNRGHGGGIEEMEGEAVNRPLPHQLGLSQFIKHSFFLALTFLKACKEMSEKKVIENWQKQKRMQQTEPLAFKKPKFRERDPTFKKFQTQAYRNFMVRSSNQFAGGQGGQGCQGCQGS